MLAGIASPSRASVPAAAAAILLLTAFAGSTAEAGLVASKAAGRPAADCQPYSRTPCLLPFPNNLFTRADRSTSTGLRVNLPARAMPVNIKGGAVAVAEYDRSDGFSPGSAVVVHVPGFDTPAAFAKTRSVTIT